MKIVYLPTYRLAVGYTVSFGRRWSVLEHLILVELSRSRRGVRELAELSNMPDRLVIEALIRLLRTNWVEVRSLDTGVFFNATSAGLRVAKDKDLPASLQRDVKWISVCVDRLTGAWIRADDLELVYERDLPEEAETLEPLVHTYEPNAADLRELFYLSADESLEPLPSIFRNPSKPFARLGVGDRRVETGLPAYAPMRLDQTVVGLARLISEVEVNLPALSQDSKEGWLQDDLSADDVIVGGPEHLELLCISLERAKTTFIIHSCFVNPATVRVLLPYFEKAAKRMVRIELLWGLHVDPEDPSQRNPISLSEKVLDELSPQLRTRVQFSSISSGSHAKILVYDDLASGRWVSVVGSCNFLSSEFDWIEASLVSRSQRLAKALVGQLLAAQLPASDSWSPLARRLNRVWTSIREGSQMLPERGRFRLSLLIDQDHYSCITLARDAAQKDVVIGCDLFGVAAETSVLVPMERAAETGRDVSLFYNRPSRFLREEGSVPDAAEIAKRGISAQTLPTLHAKFLFWDDYGLVISSFNWLATVVAGTRARGAEIGLLVQGDGVRSFFEEKWMAATRASVNEALQKDPQ